MELQKPHGRMFKTRKCFLCIIFHNPSNDRSLSWSFFFLFREGFCFLFICKTVPNQCVYKYINICWCTTAWKKIQQRKQKIKYCCVKVEGKVRWLQRHEQTFCKLLVKTSHCKTNNLNNCRKESIITIIEIKSLPDGERFVRLLLYLCMMQQRFCSEVMFLRLVLPAKKNLS